MNKPQNNNSKHVLRDGKKFGERGRFFSGSAVSPQLNIVYTFDSYYTKGDPWNSLMKAATPTYGQVPNSTTPDLEGLHI